MPTKLFPVRGGVEILLCRPSRLGIGVTTGVVSNVLTASDRR